MKAVTLVKLLLDGAMCTLSDPACRKGEARADRAGEEYEAIYGDRD